MTTTAQKWDAHFATCDLKTPAPPCFVLQQHSRLIPFKGKGLDVACGLGGNARFLAQCGLKIDAWDISDNALTILNNFASLNHLPIQATLMDLDQVLMPYQSYDVISVSHYLNRGLFKQLIQALKPNGKLFYQTFLGPVQTNAPRNPDFYLHSGELIQLCSSMQIDIYGEGWLAHNDGKNRYAWMVATKK